VLTRFVFVNIWFILGINILLILFLIIYKLMASVQEKKYQAFIKSAKNEFEMEMLNLTPEVFAAKYKHHYKHQMIYRLMLEIANEKGYDFHLLFDQIGFTDEVINHFLNNKDSQLLKELSIIKSPKAYSLLLHEIQSPQIEISFRAGFAIACLKLSPIQQREAIEALLSSRIVAEKVIDIMNMISPPLDEYIQVLDEQTSHRGRIILLNYLYNKISPLITNYRYLQKKLTAQSDTIIQHIAPLLQFSESVALSAIKVLGITGHNSALLLLLNLYKQNPSSSIKSAIASMLNHFPALEVVNDLKIMAMDKDYWVRVNAYESLSDMGEVGKKAILELSATSPYPSTNFLVYQILSKNENLQQYFENYKKELEEHVC